MSESENSARGIRERARLGRRGWTVLLSGVLVLVFVLVGTFVRVPYVVLGPGPTFNTLGKVHGEPVVQVKGHKTYETEGELRMVTVSFSDDVTLFGALGMWLSGRHALAPREAYFEQGETEEEFQEQSQQQFQRSQSEAVVAALRKLGYPTKVVVDGVVPDTPAAAKPKDTFPAGERIAAVDGTEVSTAREVRQALKGSDPGDTVSVMLVDADADADAAAGSDGSEGSDEPPDDAKRAVKVKLGKRPDSDDSDGFIGIKLKEQAAVPFDIDISLEEVGGPSAGMMFALAIIDELRDDSLTGGHALAGTGTIDSGGQVGQIGGIQFKLTAAREAGARSFLVPAGNCATAVETAPEGLKLIKVGTLDGAVDALARLDAGKSVPTC